MPIFKLTTVEDHSKIGLIRNLARESGSIHCISSFPPHECNVFNSETIVLVIYDNGFKPALQAILSEVFALYGPEPYGMASDTTQDEFIQLKIGLCICGFSTF